MIRLTLLLCAGLYVALLVLGEDRGQKRYGLLLAETSPPVVAEPVAETPVEKVVFIPAQPVMKPADLPDPTAAQPLNVSLTPDLDETLPEPEMAEGRLFLAASAANVRSGPGKGFDVVGRLAAGEQVLVIPDEAEAAGWLRIRIEGDGVEGFVARRLLTEAP